MNRPVDVPLAELLGTPAEHPACGPVDVGEPAVPVERVEPFDHRVGDNAAELLGGEPLAHVHNQDAEADDRPVRPDRVDAVQPVARAARRAVAANVVIDDRLARLEDAATGKLELRPELRG